MTGFRLPTRVLIAAGASERTPEVLRELGAESALLVVDPGLAATPWPERLQELLSAAGLRAELTSEVESNPRTSSAEHAAERAREGGFEAVVGLGGGSVLDAAKAAAMLATNGGEAVAYEGRDRFSQPPLPFVAVPTTCGTGSEVTWVSVLSHEQSRRKISVKGEAMFPKAALVDADLVATLPPHLVAWTGLDALTHALEAYTSKRANAVSDVLATEAVRLVFRYLERAVADVADDDEARAGVMRASTLAGMAFGNADVGAVHCLSETLGGLYDVPHGLANALLLVPVLRYQLAYNQRQLARLLLNLESDADSETPPIELATWLLEDLEELIERLAPPSFASLGVPETDYDDIAERAAANGSNPSNPRRMTPRSYRTILGRLPKAEG